MKLLWVLILGMSVTHSQALETRPARVNQALAAHEEKDFDDADLPSAGGIIKFGEDIAISEREQVNGPVVAIGGSIRIDGTVNGPVVSLGGSTRLGTHAEVDGPVISIGGKSFRAPGARVEGAIVDTPGARFFGGLAAILATLAAAWASLFVLAKLSASIGWIILAAALAALFPEALANTKRTLNQRAGSCALAGILVLPCLGVLALTLLFSLIGIPLIPLLLALAAAAYVWGLTALGAWLGGRVGQGRWNSLVTDTVVGMALLKIMQWIPFVHWVICLATAALGLGAALLSRFGYGKPQNGRSV